MSLRISLVLALTMAIGGLPAVAQISNIDPTQITHNGSAQLLTQGEGGPSFIQLTQDGAGGEAGSAWWNTPQAVQNGFTSVFTFKVSHTTGGMPADGIAFVIQNCMFNCGESGQLFALGGTGGDIGYGSIDGEPSIDNSLAIEFDTYQNGWDPNANHVAVQSCGTGNNTPDHTVGCTLGIQPMPGINIVDGNVHTVTLQYDPEMGESSGLLSVFVDNTQVPILAVSVNLDQLLNLVPNEGPQLAYVGFTGGTGAATEEGDILSWTFTPSGSNPTPITQTLTPGPGQHFTNYVFGSYNQKYQYSGAQNGDVVTVAANPSNPSFVNGLIDGSFPGSSCIIYDGTGGECVIFQVTCNDGGNGDCASLPYNLFDSYNTNQQITNPCFLKSEDNGATWINIQTSFSEIRFDPTSGGRGSPGFSWFVVAENCTATMPANRLTGNNCNGTYQGIYHGNLTVSAGQSCIFTGGGVSGNVMQSGGSLVLQGSSSVGNNLQASGGTLYLTNTTVGNNLQISGPTSFAIGPGTSIGNNLQIQNTSGTGTNQVCGATVRGNLQVQNNATAIQIGSSTPNICAGNTVGGNLQVQNNSATTTVDANTVNSNLQDQSNTGATDVSINHVNKNLQCSGNTSITDFGGPNTAKSKQGQCAAF